VITEATQFTAQDAQPALPPTFSSPFTPQASGTKIDSASQDQTSQFQLATDAPAPHGPVFDAAANRDDSSDRNDSDDADDRKSTAGLSAATSDRKSQDQQFDAPVRIGAINANMNDFSRSFETPAQPMQQTAHRVDSKGPAPFQSVAETFRNSDAQS